MKIAVIGVGGTGSAACRHLAKAGHTVVGYEQFALGHERGSSHGESRIIRYTYPDLLYTQMMGDAYPLWADLEAEAEEELFVRCGGLYFGMDTDRNVQITEEALRNAGLPYDRLSPDEVQTRFPAVCLQPDEIALYQRESGLLRSTRCVLANARLARTHGATIREETAVQAILPQGDEVVVRTTTGEETVFDRAIVTAGAWMNHLLSDLRLSLRVTLQRVLYFAIEQHAERFQPGAFPVWIDSTANYYGFPGDGHIPGVKLASHTQGAVIDPDAPRPDSDEAYVRAATEYIAQRFPDLSDRLTFTQTCLYTNTANEDFILDHVPQSPNIWLVSGCSGHGFKFTVLLGKIVAGLVTGEPYPRDLSRFALHNFTEPSF